MKITCISTSNTVERKDKSASTQVCKIIKNQVEQEHHDATVEIQALMDYELMPCKLCGECFNDEKCIYDDDFNTLFKQMKESDALFVVVPHYSPIPSKLIIMFEKINEIIYSNYLNDKNYKVPFMNMPIGIIGHGGMTESKEVLEYYHNHLVTPVAMTFRQFGFKPIGIGETSKNGVTFGLQNNDCIKETDKAIFPEIIQDYEKIAERIKPLVTKVIEAI